MTARANCVFPESTDSTVQNYETYLADQTAQVTDVRQLDAQPVAEDVVQELAASRGVVVSDQVGHQLRCTSTLVSHQVGLELRKTDVPRRRGLGLIMIDC